MKHDIPQKLTDADYADHIALLANTPAQAESILNRLEQVARGIDRCECK